MLSRGRKFSREFKLMVMREIEAGARPAELCRKYDLHPRVIGKWQKKFREDGERAFPKSMPGPVAAGTVAELERQIGQQTMEIAFLKKVLNRLESRLRSMPKDGADS